MIEASRRLRPMALAALVLLGACGGQEPAARPTLVIETDGGDVEVAVEIADSSDERARGLMGREELADGAGMVFLVGEPVPSAFWMKGTLIPLSIAFWGRDQRIFRILDMDPCRAEPCPLYDPRGQWVGALEVNQGFFRDHGVEVGDAVRLER
jgi:uncharacterized membrane protein (UPF0127 family)